MAGYKVTVRTGLGDQVFNYLWLEDVTSLLCDMLRGTKKIDLLIEREDEDE